MKLRELPIEFEKKGVRFTLLERKTEIFTDDNGTEQPFGYLIYSCKDITFGNVYYEVFRYKISKPHPMDKGDWDMVELYPSSESFGVWAWCCSDLECIKKVMFNHFDIDWKEEIAVP